MAHTIVAQVMALSFLLVAVGDDQEEALLVAADKGDTTSVRALVEAGANVNAKSPTSKTPLMAAAAGGHAETVSALLDAGAKINAKADNDRVALSFAAENGHPDVVRILLDGRAKVDIGDKPMGFTPLMHAAASGHDEIVSLLLDGGTSVNKKNVSGTTALMIVSRLGRVSMVKALLRAGADVNEENDSGWTALVEAKRCGQREASQLLEDAGAKAVSFPVSEPYELRPMPDGIVTKPVIGPRPVICPQPKYPLSVVHNKVQGTIVLEVLIDEKGEVTVLKVLCSIPELDNTAIDTVERKWKFRPATKKGRPVSTLAEIAVSFRLY